MAEWVEGDKKAPAKAYKFKEDQIVLYRAYDKKKSGVVAGLAMFYITKPGVPNEQGVMTHGVHIGCNHGGTESWHAMHDAVAYHFCKCKSPACKVKPPAGKEAVHIDRWKVITEGEMRTIRSRWKKQGQEFTSLAELGHVPLALTRPWF